MYRNILWPLGAGLAGMIFLASLYFGIVTWAESGAHAVDLFWENRLFIIPLILGFGLQVALATIIKKRLFFPTDHNRYTGTLTGAGGTTSTAAMVACCAHHATDIMPFLGLSAAASFLAHYQVVFMVVGLVATYGGAAFMLRILFQERNKAIQLQFQYTETN